jgi:hypothetical protein
MQLIRLGDDLLLNLDQMVSAGWVEFRGQRVFMVKMTDNSEYVIDERDVTAFEATLRGGGPIPSFESFDVWLQRTGAKVVDPATSAE